MNNLEWMCKSWVISPASPYDVYFPIRENHTPPKKESSLMKKLTPKNEWLY